MSTPVTPVVSLSNQISPWLTIASVAVPEVLSLVNAVRALVKKYPDLTADQINAAVASITGTADAAFDDVLAKIAADRAASAKSA